MCTHLLSLLWRNWVISAVCFAVSRINVSTQKCCWINTSGYWHDAVVCPSVRLSVTNNFTVAKWYILQQINCLNPWIESAPRNTISTPYIDIILSNAQPIEPFGACQLVNTLKHNCEQANLPNFHVWNKHRQHAARLFLETSYDRLFLSNSWATYYQLL